MKRIVSKWLTAACLTALGAGVGIAAAALGPAHAVYAAAVPKLDMVRVGLFMDTGKYSANTPAVTLFSGKGLDIGFSKAAAGTGANGAGNGGDGTVLASVDKSNVRASLDAHRVLLWETSDAAQAKALAQKLGDANTEAAVLQRMKQGKAAYQVSVGPYASKEAAAAALTKLLALPEVGSAVKGFASVTGPLHWNAGVYAAEAQAQQQASAIAQAGFDADVAVLDVAAGAPAYAVLVAAAADAAELNTAKQQLSAAFPGLALQPVDPAASYVLKRAELDASPDSQAAGALQRLLLGGMGIKVAVSPKPAETVNVLERAERAYRGGLELSRLNGKLAVVNELPVDQYLASVVGSELNKEWPLEALKAQAVAARTYMLRQGLKYQIAHVSDSTIDQVYKGAGAEFAEAQTAVSATQGEVLANASGLIDPLFSSNAGGKTAESTEIWGNKVSYLKSVETPDEGAEKGKAVWYRIVLPNGNAGYIHSSYAKDTGQKNAADLPYYESNATGVSVRTAPFVDNATNPALFKVDIGDRFVVFDQAVESNAYSWLRGPFEGDKLKEKVNTVLAQPITGALERLEISARGTSGRVTEMKANGQALKPANPDALRTVFNGLPSTRFEIEETGSYTILGANNNVRKQSAASPNVVIASGSGPAKEAAGPQLFIMGGSNRVSMKDRSTRFIFKGNGSGHGLGMSQWGAKGYAELGYDYKKILQTYYDGVSIIKE
ncbi:SpoIID/LytB domain-containing protein [Paenibacillus piri]|uniref:SpoIID/LytB domain-containing protein n=1 Tax=Paenibacillus piri TaxID=2547395 RepID=A0A4R5KPQ0_9BACL|nr:SpoIID/LytB domain-containing protein [Paenibacillus piri]TDF97661.1 SpoIID/LytB domain-containing protein [Paenibacillus piri]